MKDNKLYIHANGTVTVLDFNLIKKYTVKFNEQTNKFILFVLIDGLESAYSIDAISIEINGIDKPIHWELKRILNHLKERNNVDLPSWMNKW